MNDFDFLKNKLEQDGIQTPESLSKENMLRRLQTADEIGELRDLSEPVRLPWYKNRRFVGYAAALAACLALTLIAVPTVRRATGHDSARTIPHNSAEYEAAVENGEVQTFENEEELQKKISNINKPGLFDWFSIGGKNETTEVAGDDELASIDESDVPLAAPGESAKSHSETYKQVEDVDEADIIKTDGEFIYLVNGYNEVEIYKAKEGKTEKTATISRFEKNGSVENLYLSGDRLVTIGYVYDKDGERSVVTSYDISDHAKPREIGHFEQSGYLVSSRMVNGIVYIITNEYADSEHYIPYILTDSGYEAMSATDVSAFPHPDQASYVTVSSVRFKNSKKIESETKAVLGASGDIYCNTKNLYIASTDYSTKSTATRIMKIGLKDGKLSFDAVGKVRGTAYGQFAMDEKDGFFRIATTADRNGHDVNNLYVLDEKLEEVGSVTGFARNEHIEAVRFIGEKAYIITYEQIDPLFILDLADPTAPKIDGEVEITGFSTMLVPISDKRLIGIGYGTEDNVDGSNMSNDLKIALFDISDPSNPRVLDSKQFANMNSEAQYDHHALLENKEAGYLAVPYDLDEDVTIEDDVIIEDAEIAESGDGNTDAIELPKPETMGGVLVFSAGEKITVEKNYETEDGVRRCIYIGDYIYAVQDSDEIVSFKM